jgi:hypothetical protein
VAAGGRCAIGSMSSELEALSNPLDSYKPFPSSRTRSAPSIYALAQPRHLAIAALVSVLVFGVGWTASIALARSSAEDEDQMPRLAKNPPLEPPPAMCIASPLTMQVRARTSPAVTVCRSRAPRIPCPPSSRAPGMLFLGTMRVL